jgi:hypothetical protein
MVEGFYPAMAVFSRRYLPGLKLMIGYSGFAGLVCSYWCSIGINPEDPVPAMRWWNF